MSQMLGSEILAEVQPCSQLYSLSASGPSDPHPQSCTIAPSLYTAWRCLYFRMTVLWSSGPCGTFSPSYCHSSYRHLMHEQSCSYLYRLVPRIPTGSSTQSCINIPRLSRPWVHVSGCQVYRLRPCGPHPQPDILSTCTTGQSMHVLDSTVLCLGSLRDPQHNPVESIHA